MKKIYDKMQNIVDIMEYIDYHERMKNKTNMKMKLARVERSLSQQHLADKVDATRQTRPSV
jgi:hypothetical protein